MSKYTIFIFRRDLRIVDNKCLNYISKSHGNIIPIFIFTPEQIVKNDYRSDNSVQFMVDSLIELNEELVKKGSKLHIFFGDNIKVISKIINKIDVGAIAFNLDYTPYAIKRDKDIIKMCRVKGIDCITIEDYLMSNIGEYNKNDKDRNPYLVFTPFRNNAMKFKVDKPSGPIRSNSDSKTGNFTKTSKIDSLSSTKSSLVKIARLNPSPNQGILKGGRKEGLKVLNKVGKQKKYNKTRNTPSIETTMLSSYIKFGCVSIREVYWKIRNKLGVKNELLSQLYWREFYYYISYYFPRTLKGKNFNEKFDGIRWTNNKRYFKAWCDGTTGYPIVDAGMRQLIATGYMHNRMRLITSNFLNRILGINWRWGEKYYANMLTDYDPAVNNGNWQWIASTGVDTKPYSQRIFNPWAQGKKYDEDCLYIKKWIPELVGVENKHIHQWNKYHTEYDLDKIDYYEPIIDYSEGRQRSIMQYQSII